MKKPKYVPRVSDDRKAEPFVNAEEAWFWYVRCQKARRDGARFEHGMAQVARPCDPDDIYRIVLGLYRASKLCRRKFDVLVRYGFRELAPDPRCDEEKVDARHWADALDLMTTVLSAKDLLRHDPSDHPGAPNSVAADNA